MVTNISEKPAGCALVAEEPADSTSTTEELANSVLLHQTTRWFKYDRDKLWLVYTQTVPVIFEPPCTWCHNTAVLHGDGESENWPLYLVCHVNLCLLQITRYDAPHPVDNARISITIILKKKKRLGECIHLYNVLFRKIMTLLDMACIGRQHFSPQNAHPIPQHK
jgi:hypothetical protein